MNNCFNKKGFLATEIIKPEKTVPIPTPDPAKEIVAKPAPINFALSTIKGNRKI